MKSNSINIVRDKEEINTSSETLVREYLLPTCAKQQTSPPYKRDYVCVRYITLPVLKP
jgi:hypothetical protein